MHSDNRKESDFLLTSSNKANGEVLTYKDVSLLSKFIDGQGKIIPRRVSGLKSKQQKKVTKLIKQARVVALLPFVIGKW